MSEENDTFHNAINMNSFKDLEDVLDNASDSFDVNQVIPTRYTAMHVAVEYNNIVMTKLLLENKADASLKTAHGDTCLHLAAKIGNVNMVELLMQHVNIDVLNSEGCTPLHEAVKSNKIEIVKLLLDEKAQMDTQRLDNMSGGNTPLHDAVENSNLPMIELLLSNGANPNITNQHGESPFYSSLTHFLNFDDILTVVNLFLKYGACVNLKNGIFENALHLAAFNCPLEVVERLLQMDMNVDELSEGNLTPLHAAIMSYDDQTLRKVQLLVKHGADINAVDEKGDAPLNTAAMMQNLEVVSYLMANGAEINHERKERLAVYNALENGNLEMVQKFVECGAIIDFNDERVLHRCISMNSTAGLKYLLDNGTVCDPNSDMGQQVFLYVVRNIEVELMQYFLDNGADVNLLYKSSESEIPLRPLDYAHGLYNSNHPGSTKVIARLIKHISMLEHLGYNVDEDNITQIKSEQWMLDIYTECKEHIIQQQTAEMNIEAKSEDN